MAVMTNLLMFQIGASEFHANVPILEQGETASMSRKYMQLSVGILLLFQRYVSIQSDCGRDDSAQFVKRSSKSVRATDILFVFAQVAQQVQFQLVSTQDAPLKEYLCWIIPLIVPGGSGRTISLCPSVETSIS